MKQVDDLASSSAETRRDGGWHPLGQVSEEPEPGRSSPVRVTTLDAPIGGRLAGLTRAASAAEAASRIMCPELLPVLDVRHAEGRRLAFVTEAVTGDTLASRVASSPLPTAEVLGVLRQTARGLRALHRATLTHGALSGASIVVSDTSATPNRVRLTDLGLGVLTWPEHTRDAAFIPTSPERILGLARGPSEDVYQWGCIAYWLLCGHPPFDGVAANEIRRSHAIEDAPELSRQRGVSELHPAIARIVMRCLAKEPEDRPDNGAMLEAALCEAQIQAGTTTPWDHLDLPDVQPQRRERIARGFSRLGVEASVSEDAAVFEIVVPDPTPPPEPAPSGPPARVVPAASGSESALAPPPRPAPSPLPTRPKSPHAGAGVLPHADGRRARLRVPFPTAAEVSSTPRPKPAVPSRRAPWLVALGLAAAVAAAAVWLMMNPDPASHSDAVVSEATVPANSGASSVDDPRPGPPTDDDKVRGEGDADSAADPEPGVPADGAPNADAAGSDQPVAARGAEAQPPQPEAGGDGGVGSDGGAGSDDGADASPQPDAAADTKRQPKRGQPAARDRAADARNAYTRGLAAFNRGDYTAAVRSLKVATQKAPGNAEYRVRLGDAYYKLDRYENAKKQFGKASRLGHPGASRRLSRVEAKLGGS